MAFGANYTTTTNLSPYIQAAPAAANILSQGAQQASQYGVQGLAQAGQQLQGGNQASLQFTNPYINAGQSSLTEMMNLLGLTGQNPTSNLRATPGYQFQLQEGVEAINRGAAQQGKLYSGQAMKELQQYGQGLADKTYQQQQDNLYRLLGVGSQFAGQQGAQQYNLGQQLGQLASQAGQVQGDAANASAAAQAQGLLRAAEGQVAQSSISGLNANAPQQQQAVFYGGSDRVTAPGSSPIPGFNTGSSPMTNAEANAGLGGSGSSSFGSLGNNFGFRNQNGSLMGGNLVPGTNNGQVLGSGNPQQTGLGSNLINQVPATGGSNPDTTPTTGAPANNYQPTLDYTSGGLNTGGAPITIPEAAPEPVNVAFNNFNDRGLSSLADASTYAPGFGDSLMNESPETQTIINNAIAGANIPAGNSDGFYRALAFQMAAAPGFREPQHINNMVAAAESQADNLAGVSPEEWAVMYSTLLGG